MEGVCRLSNRVPVESSWSGIIARLDCETNETLFAYAQFIGEPTDYVLNQVIDTVLGKDKDFQGGAPNMGVVRATSRKQVHRSRRATERHPGHQRDNADLAAVGSARG